MRRLAGRLDAVGFRTACLAVVRGFPAIHLSQWMLARSVVGLVLVPLY
jgi:hypothetical protein